MKNQAYRRVVALLLCAVLFASPLTDALHARAADDPAPRGVPAALKTAEGEIAVEEDWDEVYPFGTFAFGAHQADVAETGALTADGEEIPDVIEIPVYRLGGTTGRVTAKITYAPAVTTDPDGEEKVYDYAASGKSDVQIEYENPSPIAAYQDPGVPAELRRMLPGELAVVADGGEAPAADDPLTLSVSGEAESWRWQAKDSGGWQDVQDADGATLSALWGDVWDYEQNLWSGTDFRCIYTVGGETFCSVSLLGEVYEPLPETPPMPEDLDADADPGYAALTFDGEFDMYEFSLTFADGETVKYIRIRALDDAEAELPEVGLFTIAACEGGELSDMCNTLTLMVSDNDTGEASQVGFAEEAVTADRAGGAVSVPVVRTGGKTYNVTVHYETVDGTAVEGVDYARKEGDLAFAGSIDEIAIPIELIAGAGGGDKTLKIVLSDLRGGGDLCSLGVSEITVTLTGEARDAGQSAGQNLASVLAAGESESVSLNMQSEALIPEADVVRADTAPEPSAPLTAELAAPGGPATKSHVVNPHFVFRRTDLAPEGASGNGTGEASEGGAGQAESGIPKYEEKLDAYMKSGYWADWEVALGSMPIDNDGNQLVEGKSTQNLRSKLVTTKEQASNNNGGEILVTDLTNFSYNGDNGTEYIPKYTRISANYNSTVTFPAGSGYQFSDFMFITRLSEVGTKAVTGTDKWLRPFIRFWMTANQDMDAVSTKFNVKSKTDRRFFWYSSISQDPAGNHYYIGSFGGNNKEDTFNGIGEVQPHPIGFGKAVEMDVDFAMRDQWNDEKGSWSETCHNGEHTAIDILNFAFKRRTFTTTGGDHGINLVLYTANDEDEAGKYTPIEPDNSLYQSITPKISVVEGAGGVSSDGSIYVGSRLRIDASTITGFSIPDNGLFLTNSAGKKVGTVEAEIDAATQNKTGRYYITMQWTGMKQADLNEEYQLNIILNRRQNVRVNIAPSTPRISDGVTIDSGRYDETFDAFFSGEIKPTATCSALCGDATDPNAALPKKLFTETAEITLNRGSFGNGDSGVYTTSARLENIQSINFHQDPEDVILYDGQAYAGDQDIPLVRQKKDSSGKASVTLADSPTFTFYDSKYLDAVSPMKVLIDHVEVYYDTNGDGEIAGSLDKNGDFIPSQNKDGSYDRLEAVVEGDYADSTFAAYKDAGNKVHQYFFKVFLTIQPRALKPVAGAGEDDRSQLLPAFLSAVTNADEASALTDEQRSVRYILGANTDDHPVYGAEATAMTYVDIPLGGDVGEKTMESETVAKTDANGKITGASTVTKYGWKPEYTGQLLVPFENPTPIVDNDNITGGAVAIAGESPKLGENGVYAYSQDGRDNVNANLGSFSGRTTFAIGIQEQVKPTVARPAAKGGGSEPGIESMDDIHPETLAMGTVSSMPGADANMNPDAGGDPGQTGGEGPGSDVGHEEFSPDLGLELPSLELELGNYATVIIDGYQVGFAVGIPIYKYENTTYSGSEKSSTETDGTKKKSYVDEKGTTVTDTERPDGTKTHSETSSTTDPKDPNYRTEETRTKITKPDGTEGYYNSTTEYRKDEDGKEHPVRRKVDTNQPNTSSNKSDPDDEKGGFKKGAAEANSQMATLNEFAKALMSPTKGSMKKFKDDLFDDDSLNNAKNGNTTSKKVEVNFTVQISMMFEFNPIDNGYYFKSAGLAATLGVEFTIQHRFTPCPLVYVYVKIGLEVEVKVALSVLRQAKEGSPILDFRQGSLAGLAGGEKTVFALNMKKVRVDPTSGKSAGSATVRGFHIMLDGKVYMEVFDNEQCTGKALTSGTLSGDGGVKEVLFEAYNKQVYVRLTPVGAGVSASGLRPVIGATSKVVFDGLSITPGISLEAGVGVGVEVAHFELYVKTSVSITMTMGGYLKETDRYEGFYISSFEWALSVGFHLTVLFFNYSMDCIAIGVTGEQHGTGGYFSWEITASAADGNHVIWQKNTYTSADAKSLPGEPEPPTGVNIYKDDSSFTFYNADGSLCDPGDPNKGDWHFPTRVSAARWGGGDFKGEVPMNADCCYAAADGAKVTFSTDASDIKLYFDGRVTVSSDLFGAFDEMKKSPAEISFGNTGRRTHTVTITAKKGTKLDRFTVGKAAPPRKSASPVRTVTAEARSLVHVTGPTDVSATQTVHTPEPSRRAIRPTGTDDFQISGYNVSGDAKKLVSGLATGYSYKLFRAGDDCYILYPLMLGGVPQLVMSKVVMTGDLATIDGLENPLNRNAKEAYILVDGDGTADYDFSVDVSGTEITAVWVSARSDGTGYSVRHAALDLGAQPDGFSEAKPYTASGAAYSFLPAQADGLALWAEGGGTKTANTMLRAYLKAKNPTLTDAELDACATDDPTLANAVFYWAAQSKLNDLSGDAATLVSSSGARAPLQGETVDNLEAGVVDGRQCILYSTSRAAYFDPNAADVPVTVDAAGMNADTERGVIRSLYLQAVDEDGFGPAKLLQTVIDFEGCSDDTLDSAKLKDGVYVNNALQGEGQADPYYANLRFLRADLDGKGVQTAALFEMGGNTYLLTQAELSAVLNGAGAATAAPIFEKTTGADVCIGSDGRNMAAVYTAPVADSLSNAIYVAWWDSNLGEQGAWGSPTILAMRNLQIYEDRIAYDMNAEDCEKAYLGKAETPGKHTGSMSRLTFSDLQMSTRAAGASGQQLMILTQGALVGLTDQEYDMGEGKEPLKTVAPDGPAEVGFYAIAFGEGEQALGQASLTLANYDFTTDSELVGTVKFTNTGTAAVRASDAEPALVRLLVRMPGAQDRGESEELASWSLTESIPSGAQAALTFKSLPLTRNLPVGAEFWLEVSENQASFGENAFHQTLDGLLTVEKRPELSFGGFDLSLANIDAKNNLAILDLTTTVQNRGNADAAAVFIQFSYDTGRKDDNGAAIYNPMDISQNTLVTQKQEEIKKKGVTEDVANGVYLLAGEDGTDLKAGCYRTVSGTISVPIDYFAEQEDLSGLHVRAEIYSGTDTPDMIEGVYTSDHNEYNEINNQAEQTVRHATVFSVPNRISTALGNTLTMPVSYASTSANPEIVLTEISDGSEDWSPLMGMAYYDPSRKVIVAAPNTTARQLLEEEKEPTGILQIRDLSTNSISTITFRVGETADGVNIYRDDASFRFFNPDGSRTNTDAAEAAGGGWRFQDKGTDIGWIPGDQPMNHDLSVAAADGAYVQFDTVAAIVSIVFTGEITVSSTLDGREHTFTESPAVLEYENGAGKTHTLTVKASEGTRLDRYAATYLVDTVPDADPDAPQILWSRSFPDAASCMPGTPVALTCYIIDSSSIRSVTFNDEELSETTDPKLTRLSDSMWRFDCTVTGNTPLKVRAYDAAGNSSRQDVAVNWFNDILSEGAAAGAPAITDEQLRFVDAAGNPVSDSGTLDEAPWLTTDYAPGSGETVSAELLSGRSRTPLTGENGRWKVPSNGFCIVRVDRPDGTWGQAVKHLSNLDLDEPLLTLQIRGDKLQINASDNSMLTGVTVNGYPLKTGGRTYTGRFLLRCSGEYTVTVTDNVGHTVSRSITADLPLDIRDSGVDVERSCFAGAVTGDVTVDPAGIIGGDWLPEESDPAQNRYVNHYYAAIVPAGTDPASVPDSRYTAMETPHTFAKLQPGEYTILLKDAAGKTGAYSQTVVLTHPEDAWQAPTYEWSDDLKSVTACRICTLDKTHFELETVKTEYSVVRPATAASDGEGVYRAVFRNPAFDAVSRSVVIPAQSFFFDDVKDPAKFYYTPVYWAYNHSPQITNGIDDIYFGPDQGCTRGQVVTFLWRAAGCPEPRNAKTAFTDLKPGGFYVKAVAWAVENEITNGMSATSFAPDSTCTRGQIVTFLWRFRNKVEPKSAQTGFTDVPDTAFYARAVAWAVENGITNGMTKTTFGPENTCTRGQVVTFLYRAMND